MEKSKIEAFEKIIKQNQIDAYLVPSWDCFFGEETQEKKLAELTNFAGSNGIALLGENFKVMFTDGRYLVECRKTLPNFEIIDLANESIISYCQKKLPHSVIGFDDMIFSFEFVEKLQQICQVKFFENDLVSEVIKVQKPQKSTYYKIADKIAGESSSNKINRICQEFEEYLLISSPYCVNWLLSIRGLDLDFSPIYNSFAVLYKNGEIKIFHESEIDKFLTYLQEIENSKIQCNFNKLPHRIAKLLKNSNNLVINRKCPIEFAKAVKNDAEIAAMIKAHEEDGQAFHKFRKWFKETDVSQLTEFDVAEKLLEFRSQNQSFKGLSFETIAGSGANGAIIHYRASKKDARKITDDETILIDSGGQYYDENQQIMGTTDVTRVLSLKRNISGKIQKYYSLVLKGHIRLASAIFPMGTTGSQLDTLARLDLWQHGADYAHGTGHGVGAFLSVHEGPASISKRFQDVQISKNMIFSIEPGFYAEDEFGIRIENLYYVTEDEFYEKSLKFRPLTKIYIDEDLIDFNLLSDDEKKWLKQYNQWALS